MNLVFAARLTALRKESGMSQKDAANVLGISQALLSHYEKGIRECSLDFVCRASSCFDVSCDYLLGQVDSRRSLNEEFDMTDTVQDREYRTSTLFRAAAMLNDSMSKSGAEGNIKDFYALSIFRMAVCAAKSGYIPKKWISLDFDVSPMMASALMGSLARESSTCKKESVIAESSEPQCVRTIIERAESIIKAESTKLVKV